MNIFYPLKNRQGGRLHLRVDFRIWNADFAFKEF